MTHSLSKEKEVNTELSCPIGQHPVRAHTMHVSPTKKHPDGLIQRRAHCAKNRAKKPKPAETPSKKDILSFEEIICVSEAFYVLVEIQKLNPLTEFKDSAKYDTLILGWVQYWNEIFKLTEPLDPRLVKALMATESSFKKNPKAHPNEKASNRARGLLQVMDSTLDILKDPKGELKNHLLDLTKTQIIDPSANICAGVRWLFQKKKLTDAKLKREATWEEAIADYKGYLAQMLSGENPNPKGMSDLKSYYARLKA